MSMTKRVVVITGASSGIGAATAVEFARNGSRLVLHGRNEANLKAIADKCVGVGLTKDDIAIVMGDLFEDSTISKIVKTTLDTFGTIHVLYNNAGIISKHEGPLHMGGKVESLDEMYRLHLRVPYMLSQQFIPELTKTKGVIINCSSVYSQTAVPDAISSCSIKAGLDHFTRTLAMSLSMRGIRVNSVNLGYVPTNAVKTAYDDETHHRIYQEAAKQSPLEQKLATPEDVANTIVFLASDKAVAITGQNVFCDKAVSLTSIISDFTSTNMYYIN